MEKGWANPLKFSDQIYFENNNIFTEYLRRNSNREKKN